MVQGHAGGLDLGVKGLLAGGVGAGVVEGLIDLGLCPGAVLGGGLLQENLVDDQMIQQVGADVGAVAFLNRAAAGGDIGGVIEKRLIQLAALDFEALAGGDNGIGKIAALVLSGAAARAWKGRASRLKASVASSTWCFVNGSSL